MTEIPTAAGKLYLATVIHRYSRRLLGAATSLHPDADLACAAIRMAVAARGGRSAIWREDEAERVIFHADRGTYTANAFTKLCRQQGIRQSMGRVGSTTPQPRRSSPRWSGRSSRHEFKNTGQAQAVVLDWCYGLSRPTAQLSGHDEPRQLREHRGPRPGSRIEKPSTIRGEPHSASS